eukprot:TRINITY_DN10825_c0_g2_i2.p1 TRINITY_DN10825_c0_g2~~TRINITY_DN10825_c0_g2_i2.p1  ORF type:complete len:169 (+),score=30.21 TRINITY_DN10825_c0_g2_i2:52-507(+)
MASVAGYRVVGEKFFTLASEEWRMDLRQTVPDLLTACRLLMDFYISVVSYSSGDALYDFDSFSHIMRLPKDPSLSTTWQTAFEQAYIHDSSARNALPPDVYISVVQNWLNLINGVEPPGCGDHAPVVRLQLLDQNGVNLLRYDDTFERKLN